MTNEFSVVTDGNRESFIHGTHTECSPITPINLNKTQVCQHHPSPPHHLCFLGSISKATSCMLLWDCILTLCSLRCLFSSASLCCLLLALMGCLSHMAQVIGGPGHYLTCLALHFALSMKLAVIMGQSVHLSRI